MDLKAIHPTLMRHLPDSADRAPSMLLPKARLAGSQRATVVAYPLGFSVLNNEPENKVTVSEVITLLQPCLPEPNHSPIRKEPPTPLTAPANMQKKKPKNMHWRAARHE